MIKLHVTELKKNPDYAEEMKEYRQNERFGRMGGHDNYPQKNTEEKTLAVEITEKQFESIRKEVLKNF